MFEANHKKNVNLNKRIKVLFLFFLSILIYLFSPDKFDYNWCLLIGVFFILSAISEINNSKYFVGGYINFTFFFTISYFFVNFFYPLFIYPVDKYYFIVFSRFNFNENVITKSTALALVGFNAFIIGKNYVFNVKQFSWIRNLTSDSFFLNKSILNVSFKVINFLAWFVSFTLYSLVIDSILSRNFDAFFQIEPSIMVIVQCLMNLVVILVFYLGKSRYFLSVVFLYIFIFVYVGDRGPAIQSFLVLLFSYNFFYKRILKKQLLIIFVLGFVGLTVVSSIRGSEGNAKSINEVEITKIYDLAMDLIIINRNLYAGYDYVNLNGVNYGESSVPYIFSPFPLLPSFVSTKFFNKTPSELSTSYILTNDAGASWGLGTNLIIDLYMQFAEFGVVFFMFFLGKLIQKLEKSIIYSFKSLVAYLVIFSFSIYMARSSMFDSIRYIFWSIVLFQVIYLFLNYYAKDKNISSK